MFFHICTCYFSKASYDTEKTQVFKKSLMSNFFFCYVYHRSSSASAMATAQCADGQPQPSQPGLNRANPNSQPNTTTGLPNPRQHGTQHSYPVTYTSQAHQPAPPYTSYSHTQILPHPFMYLPHGAQPQPHPQPPPMPLCLQYQWPMHFSYNPFAGFPAMGECCNCFFKL